MIDLAAIRRRALLPEPQTLVSDWADAKRELPNTSAEPGRWRTSRTPYLKEIMDCLSVSSAIENVVVMKAAQLGLTEAALNFCGYVIENAPGVLLFVNPTEASSQRNVRLRVDPLIETTSELKALVTKRNSRRAGNNNSLKVFPGGQLSFTGANSAVGLRSIPCRYVICDEVDSFPEDADGEGDPSSLAVQRTITFRGRRKILFISTPLIAGLSRIEKAYKTGDQRIYCVPCPTCGTLQPLDFRQLSWPGDDRSRTFYICEHCNAHVHERSKQSMVAAGKWIATAPGDGKTASFHLNALYSPFVSWSEITLRHLACGNHPSLLQVFENTCLGSCWEDKFSVGLLASDLQARAHHWGDIMPAQVCLCTAGVDIQLDRIELEIVGWGKGEESWSLEWISIPGNPSEKDTWQRLDQILMRRLPHPVLGTIPIAATCIDSGNWSKNVYEFCGPRFHRRVYAIKGRSDPQALIWPRRPSRPKDGRVCNLFNVGVTACKETIHQRLKIETPGIGYCNFPDDRDADYFEQLLAEKPIRKKVGNEFKRVWIKPAFSRNEALDARVYSFCALHAMKSYSFNLDREVERVAALAAKPNAPKKTMADFARLNT